MEREFIEWLEDRETRIQRGSSIERGIGDDAAVYSAGNAEQQVITTDMLIDGVHFDAAQHSLKSIGRKSMNVSLSDIAAMGAVPTQAVVALAIPKALPWESVQSLYLGLSEAADRFSVQLIGGDTNTTPGPLVVSVTVIGEPAGGQLWYRDGAKVGDRILVTGALGGSILEKHLAFSPRLDVVSQLAELDINAATDITDGFSLDLHHILRASGCGARIQAEKIPVSDAARRLAAEANGCPLEHALSDGEDFELIIVVAGNVAATISQMRLDLPLVDVGECVVEQKLLLSGRDGEEVLTPRGFSH